MKKVVFLLLALIIITSCQSTQNESDSSIYSQEYVKNILTEALISVDSELFENESLLSSPVEYESYIKEVPRFRVLLRSYIAIITNSAKKSSSRVTDYLIEYIKSHQFEDVNTLVDKGYTSFSDYLKEKCNEAVTNLFYQQFVVDHEIIKGEFTALSYEAYIYRENLLNLTAVGKSVDIPEIESLKYSYLSHLATERYFKLLSEKEVSIRTSGEK